MVLPGIMKKLLLALVTSLAFAQGGVVLAEDAPRPAKFAKPLEAPGLSNFHEVTPQIFRSAQPLPEGFQQLKKMGIRTVISLRDDGADDDWAAGTKLKLVRVPMGFDKIDDASIAQVLALLRKKEEGPFLIHCQMGADRTGMIMALWRITEQGWSREDALAEARACGLLIESFATYVAQVDLGKLKPVKDAK